jgi:hypothetical protein
LVASVVLVLVRVKTVEPYGRVRERGVLVRRVETIVCPCVREAKGVLVVVHERSVVHEDAFLRMVQGVMVIVPVGRREEVPVPLQIVPFQILPCSQIPCMVLLASGVPESRTVTVERPKEMVRRIGELLGRRESVEPCTDTDGEVAPVVVQLIVTSQVAVFLGMIQEGDDGMRVPVALVARVRVGVQILPFQELPDSQDAFTVWLASGAPASVRVKVEIP